MTVISIIGGHDREEINTFLNDLVSSGGMYCKTCLRLKSWSELFVLLFKDENLLSSQIIHL